MVEPVLGDAFGDVLRRCWRAGGAAGAAFEVVERDDGFVSVRDASWYFGVPEQWKPVERWAVAQARGRVLDVGCGAGRHGLALLAAGHDVVGVDPSAGAREVAGARGLPVVEGSAGRLPTTTVGFDTVLLCGENLGLLGSAARAAQVLASLARVAVRGACLLATGVDPRGAGVLREYAQQNARAGRLPGQQRIRIRSGRISTPWFDYLFLTADELGALASASPWRVRECVVDGADTFARLELVGSG
jgi:SAM-dependent methyltransferase